MRPSRARRRRDRQTAGVCRVPLLVSEPDASPINVTQLRARRHGWPVNDSNHEEVASAWEAAMLRGDFEAAWRATDRIERVRRAAEAAGRFETMHRASFSIDPGDHRCGSGHALARSRDHGRLHDAHLAGALGRPVWVLLKHRADWRWMSEREDSPWYPTMRLFRQPREGDWQSVGASVALALRQRLGASGAGS